MLLKGPAEAESSARRALQLDPRSIEANFMLGLALLAQKKFTPEAAAHLAVAAPRYPRARPLLTSLEAELRTSKSSK
jgi:cytochrome c-type biogenesis protein CcmH/NrfG